MSPTGTAQVKGKSAHLWAHEAALKFASGTQGINVHKKPLLPMFEQAMAQARAEGKAEGFAEARELAVVEISECNSIEAAMEFIRALVPKAEATASEQDSVLNTSARDSAAEVKPLLRTSTDRREAESTRASRVGPDLGPGPKIVTGNEAESRTAADVFNRGSHDLDKSHGIDEVASALVKVLNRDVERLTAERDELHAAATRAANGTDGECLCDFVKEGACMQCREMTRAEVAESERDDARAAHDALRSLLDGQRVMPEESAVRLRAERDEARRQLRAEERHRAASVDLADARGANAVGLVQQLAAARTERDELRADVAIAIGKGWSNGGTLVSFCSYCTDWRSEYEGGKPHSPTCLVTKYGLDDEARS